MAVIFCHHAGKMGDVLYALPVFRALARTTGQKIHLTTSGMCWQLIPLLWEQPYFEDVVVDETRPYSIPPGGVTTNWRFYDEGQGINLSLQPKHYEPNCPISWTLAAAWIARVEVTPADYVGLPSLVNHRNWHHQLDVAYDGVPQTLTPTIVVAPEVETLESASEDIWQALIAELLDSAYHVILIGKRSSTWNGVTHPALHDLRGVTTVAVAARLIAEAQGFVGAHSLPWHLARHAHTPAICLQQWRDGLRRCLPIDTLPDHCPWVEPQDWPAACTWIRQLTSIPH